MHHPFVVALVTTVVSCAGVAAQSQAWTYGFAKPGAESDLPAIAATGGLPDTGNAGFGIAVARALGGTSAALVVANQEAAAALPWGVAWVNPLPSSFVVPVTLGGTAGQAGAGASTLPLPIPALPQLHGAQLSLQWFAIDAGLPSQLAHTEGLGLRIGDPGVAQQCPGSLAYGDYASCAMASGGLGLFTFQGSAGESFYVRSVASGFQPRLTIFDPLGTQLHDVDPGCGEVAEALTTGISATGTYQILVRDGSCFGPGQSGRFGVHLHRVSGAPGEETRAGSSVQGRFESLGYVGGYRFAASAGDSLFVRATASGAEPEALLFDPAGTLLCRFAAGCGDVAEGGGCQTAVSGVHTVLVLDGTCFGSGGTGPYTIFAEATTNPRSALTFPLGSSLNTALRVPGDVHAYVVSLAANDVLYARAVGSSHGPQLTVFDPTGAVLAQASAGCGDEAELRVGPVTTAGLHTVIERDSTCFGSRQSGSLGVYVQNLTKPGGCASVQWGTAQPVVLDRIGEVGSICIPITRVGASILVTATTTSGVNPDFTLYDAAGGVVGGASAGCGAQSSQQFSGLMPGTHVLQIQDGSCFGSGGTGTVMVSVVCLTPPC